MPDHGGCCPHDHDTLAEISTAAARAVAGLTGVIHSGARLRRAAQALRQSICRARTIWSFCCATSHVAAAPGPLRWWRAAASSRRWSSTFLYNPLDYAVELKALSANNLADVKWTAPKTVRAIDKRVVINVKQSGTSIARGGVTKGLLAELSA